MSGLQLAFWRVLLGALVYLAALTISGRRLTRAQLRSTAPAALSISLQIATFFVAVKATTIANATVIVALTPILLLAVVARDTEEQVTTWLAAMALITTGGVALVVFGSASETIWSLDGDLLSVVSLVLFACYFRFSKRARASVPAFEFQTGVWLIGTFALLPLALIDAGGVVMPNSTQWLWIAALLAGPGTGHLLMNWAHPRIRLTLSSMLTLAIPVLSTAGGAVFYSEGIDLAQVVGMCVVISVLVLVVRRDAALTGSSIPTPTPRPASD